MIDFRRACWIYDIFFGPGLSLGLLYSTYIYIHIYIYIYIYTYIYINNIIICSILFALPFMSHTLGDLGTDWDFGRSSCGRHRFHSFFGNRWDALTKARNPNINYNIILLIYIWIYIWIYIYIIRLSKYIILLIALLAVFLDRQMLDFNGSIFLEPAQLCAYFYKGHILTGKWKHMMASIFPDHQNQGWTCFFVEDFSPNCGFCQ